VDLSGPELRVVGCLVEKQLATPQQYPLTLNALTLACNQTSNRDPVVDFDEATVQQAVTSVKAKGLAAFVHPSHGRSALRFRHTVDEALGIGPKPLALLSVLFLRGPQTPGELRTRTERMVGFADLQEVLAELDALARREEPLVTRLPRVPGQKEDRFAPLWGDRLESPTTPAPAAKPTSPSSPPSDAGGEPSTATAEAFAALRAEVASLRRDLDDLRSQLGA